MFSLGKIGFFKFFERIPVKFYGVLVCKIQFKSDFFKLFEFNIPLEQKLNIIRIV